MFQTLLNLLNKVETIHYFHAEMKQENYAQKLQKNAYTKAKPVENEQKNEHQKNEIRNLVEE